MNQGWQRWSPPPRQPTQSLRSWEISWGRSYTRLWQDQTLQLWWILLQRGAAALSLIEPPLPAVDPAVIIEQVGRGLLDPNLSQEERRGRAQWTLAQLGFAPAPPNPPGPQPPSTSSHKPPPVAGRAPGMTMQQWDALQVPSGGDSSRPIAPAKKSSRRRSATKSSTVPTGKVPAQKGTTLPDKPLSSRALKWQRPYIPWEPNPEQLRHAQLLLRGEAPYAVPEPTCLAVSDPRVSGPKGACKWMCPMQLPTGLQGTHSEGPQPHPVPFHLY